MSKAHQAIVKIIADRHSVQLHDVHIVCVSFPSRGYKIDYRLTGDSPRGFEHTRTVELGLNEVIYNIE